VHPALRVETPVAVLVAAAMLLPGPDARPFKRPTLLTEHIEVRAPVFARLLFGGRVMILAREGARLSIREVSSAATIEVERGRVAVTVDRENLHPEDLVEVRTPHAVVTVPAETLVVDVGDVSTFNAVRRAVEIFRVDPVSGAAIEPPTVAAADELVTVEPVKMSTEVVANR
jgi:hypothetical protein